MLTMMNSTPIDRISNLPDEVLCHILSFLPTKLAFTTTVLSKKWTPVFKLLQTLNFDDESVASEKSWGDIMAFRAFVDNVMLSAQFIKTFHLNCESKHRHSFNHWINTAKMHPLENLQLQGKSRYNMITLCPRFFIFPTLVVLKLTGLKVVDNISVDLPSLKTLHLIDVKFQNKDNFNQLLNGCPILEDLQTREIYSIEQSYGGVRLKTLSNLTRANISTFYVPIKAIHNVQFLQLKRLDMHLEPEIKSYYKDFLVLGNLIHLELRFFDNNHWHDIVKVLKYCSKLQILTITKWSELHNKDLYRNWKNPKSVPKCISSHLRSCTLTLDGFIDGNGSQFATYILKNAPLLRLMKITVTKPWKKQDALKELKSCPRISSECELSVSSTQYLNICNFH